MRSPSARRRPAAASALTDNSFVSARSLPTPYALPIGASSPVRERCQWPRGHSGHPGEPPMPSPRSTVSTSPRSTLCLHSTSPSPSHVRLTSSARPISLPMPLPLSSCARRHFRVYAKPVNAASASKTLPGTIGQTESYRFAHVPAWPDSSPPPCEHCPSILPCLSTLQLLVSDQLHMLEDLDSSTPYPSITITR